MSESFFRTSNTFLIATSTTASTPVRIIDTSQIPVGVRTYHFRSSVEFFFVLTTTPVLAVPVDANGQDVYYRAAGTWTLAAPANSYISVILPTGTGTLYIAAGLGG